MTGHGGDEGTWSQGELRGWGPEVKFGAQWPGVEIDPHAKALNGRPKVKQSTWMALTEGELMD